MPRGNSGRIVIEIDPLLKQDLYVALARKNMTLKEWFVQRTSDLLKDTSQNQLPFEIAAEKKLSYSAKGVSK